MSTIVLDGKTLAKEIEAQLALRVAALKARTAGQTPVLATILVGDDPASATYVRMKGAACQLFLLSGNMQNNLPASVVISC